MHALAALSDFFSRIPGPRNGIEQSFYILSSIGIGRAFRHNLNCGIGMMAAPSRSRFYQKGRIRGVLNEIPQK